MNQSYQCRACRWQFSSPPRETCVICGARELDPIPSLAAPWADAEESADTAHPVQPERIERRA